MKKILALSLLFSGILFAFILLFNTTDAVGSGNPSSGNPAVTMPDSVSKFVKKTCMDCHADDGNGMARAHINFSKWDTYSAGQQADKAQDMCKVLTKGSMPKKSWVKSNPDLAP
ncbi:MAG: heme-binding domain-containing protein, partial [Bacteroidota bacterium]